MIQNRQGEAMKYRLWNGGVETVYAYSDIERSFYIGGLYDPVTDRDSKGTFTFLTRSGKTFSCRLHWPYGSFSGLTVSMPLFIATNAVPQMSAVRNSSALPRSCPFIVLSPVNPLYPPPERESMAVPPNMTAAVRYVGSGQICRPPSRKKNPQDFSTALRIFI